MIVYTPPRAPDRIPVVDLSGSKPEWEIHKACRETGFFYVASHGVPQDLIEAQFAWSERFFDLPPGEKMALDMKKSGTTVGYEPIGGQILDSQDPASEKAPPDLKETFYPGTESDKLWPAALPGFREQMLSYRRALCALGERIVRLVALSLELPQDFLAPFYRPPSATMRILRYPPHPAVARANQLGAGAHTDWGAVTLLAQDDLGGLEIRNADGVWIQATPIPGTFIINLGDLMPRWTNGLYHSTMHRVKNNDADRNRHSVVLFYNPRRDALIECLPTCTDAEHPPKYPPVTAAQHRAEMFERSYGYAPTT